MNYKAGNLKKAPKYMYALKFSIVLFLFLCEKCDIMKQKVQ